MNWDLVLSTEGTMNKAFQELVASSETGSTVGVGRWSGKPVSISPGVVLMSSTALAEKLGVTQPAAFQTLNALEKIKIIRSIESKYKILQHRGKVYQIEGFTQNMELVLKIKHSLQEKGAYFLLDKGVFKSKVPPIPPPTKATPLVPLVSYDSAIAASTTQETSGCDQELKALTGHSSSSLRSEDSFFPSETKKNSINSEEEIRVSKEKTVTYEDPAPYSIKKEEPAAYNSNDDDEEYNEPEQQGFALTSPIQEARDEEKEKRKQEAIELTQWCDGLYMLQKAYYIVSNTRPAIAFYPQKMEPKMRGIIKVYANRFGMQMDGTVDFRRGIEIIRIMMHYASMKYEEGNHRFWTPTMESWLNNAHVSQLEGLDYDPMNVLSAPIPKSAWEFNKQCRDHLNEAMSYRQQEDLDAANQRQEIK